MLTGQWGISTVGQGSLRAATTQPVTTLALGSALLSRELDRLPKQQDSRTPIQRAGNGQNILGTFYKRPVPTDLVSLLPARRRLGQLWLPRRVMPSKSSDDGGR